MTSLMKGDKVVRETGCSIVTHFYGEVISWFNRKDGRLMVVCEAPDGAIFVSDPSHLEKVNGVLDKQGTHRDYTETS